MLADKIKEKPGLFVFLISFAIFMLCQYKEGIIGYTTRFYYFVDYMRHYGFTYFPIINGQPYPDYPIGNTFLLYLASLPFGKLSVVTIGLPYCIAASLILVLIYKLGALHNKKWGFYGVLFALFTFEYIDAVHLLALDVYVALSATFCFYLVYKAKLMGNKKATANLPSSRGLTAGSRFPAFAGNDGERLHKAKSYLLFIAMFSSLLIHGPIGLIIPAGVIFSFYLLDKNWRSLLVFSIYSSMLLIIGVLLLFAAAYLQGGVKFLHDVMAAQGIGRLYGNNGFRPYFYFSNGVANYAFTLFFALAVIIKKRHSIFNPASQRDKFLSHLAIWFFMIIIALTLVHDKQASYILSIVPAISLLAAYIFVDETFVRARKILLRLCLALPFIGLLGIIFILIYNHYASVDWHGYFLGGILSLAILSGCAIIFKKHVTAIFIIGVLALMVIAFCLYWPIDFNLTLLKKTPILLSYL